MVTLVVGAGVALAVVLLAVVIARDMDRRGRNGELYAVAVLFVLPLGLAMWALDRRRPPTVGAPGSPDLPPPAGGD